MIPHKLQKLKVMMRVFTDVQPIEPEQLNREFLGTHVEVLRDNAREEFHGPLRCCVRLVYRDKKWMRERTCNGSCACCEQNGNNCPWFTDPAIQHLQPTKKREREAPPYPEKAPELYDLLKKKGFLRLHEVPLGFDQALDFLVAKGFVKCTNDDELPEYDIYSFVQDELDVGVVFDETFNERLEADERKRRALRVHWSLENALSYLDEEFFDPKLIEEIKNFVKPALVKAIELME